MKFHNRLGAVFASILLATLHATPLPAAAVGGDPLDAYIAIGEEIDDTDQDDEATREQLLRRRLKLVDDNLRVLDSELPRALADLAHFYVEVERYKEAEPHLRRMVTVTALGGSPMDRMESRLELADALHELRRDEEATGILEAAVRDAIADGTNDKRAVTQLGANLISLKRFAEAERYVRESGDQWQRAEVLEGLQRWAEAEPIWRKLGASEELEVNLRRQNKLKEATDIAKRELVRQEAEQKALSTNKTSRKEAEEQRATVALLRQLHPEGADDTLLKLMEVQATASERTAKGDPKASEKAVRETAEIKVKEMERKGRSAEAGLYRGVLQAINDDIAYPAGYVWAEDRTDGLSLERAQVAIKMAEAGNLAEAEKDLSKACPELGARSMIDSSAPEGNQFVVESPSAAECFAELALVRTRRLAPSPGTIDSTAFVAAQRATVTEAGAALQRSAARNFARLRGFDQILDQIDVNVKAMEDPAKALFGKLPPAQREERLRTPADSVEFLTELAAVSAKGRPHAVIVDRLVRELQEKAPYYFDLRSPQPIPLASLQARDGDNARLLNKDEALVLWLVVPGKRNGLVFAISKTRAAWATVGLTGSEIDERVARIRNNIDPCALDPQSADCKSGQQRFDMLASWELYQALLGASAVQKVIGAEGIKTLMIVPSGSLTTLPPALLLTEKPASGLSVSASDWRFASWLINEKAISIIPSVSVLRTLRIPAASTAARQQAASTAGRLFMVANPDFAGNGSQTVACIPGTRSALVIPQAGAERNSNLSKNALLRLPPLPCTGAEGELLKKALGGTLLTGSNARESQLRIQANIELLARAEVVAFATHGIVAGDLGLDEPALALSAPLASESGDSGFLTSSKIMGMKLSADWVLLSACNTASPDYRGAPGLSGLSRAFFFAGAKGVLVSHWRVDDEATSVLISRTVQLRRQGLGKARALQDASKEVMRGSDETAHPRFWAAFTMMGDAR